MADHIDKNWILILGHPVEKRSIWLFLIASVLCVLAAVGIYYAYAVSLASDSFEPQEITVADRTPLDDSVESGNPLRDLIARHIAATRHDQFSYFLIRGDYQQEGFVEGSFMIMGRHPGVYKQMVEIGNLKLESSYTDGAIWTSDQKALPSIGGTQVAKENRVFLFMELSIITFGWLDLNLPLGESYELLPDEEWNGRTVSVIKNRSFEVPILYYIDKETAMEVRRFATVAAEDGAENLIELIFDVPATDLQFSFPSGYECRLNGKKVNSVKFSKYEFDKWLPKVLFERREIPAPVE
ncbi:MAG: hypothetical protein ACN4GF_07880 [Lentimonas sp.]